VGLTLALPSQFVPYEAPVFPGVRLTADLAVLADQMEYRLAASRGWSWKYEAYLCGEQPLAFVQPALQEQLGDRLIALALNLPRHVTQVYDNRLDVEGFRYADDESGDKTLEDMWQANNLDEQSQMGHFDGLGLGRFYTITGAGDSADDAPVISVESPFQVTTSRDPRTRRTDVGWKSWAEADSSRWGSLYLPDATHLMTMKDGKWASVRVDQHNMGRVPVVCFAHAPRLLHPDGRSVFHDILCVADAVNKIASDMMTSAEFHAMPRRWAFGLKREDFVDSGGRAKNAWSAIAGRLWTSEKTDAKVGQFDEADLRNFHDTIKLLFQIAAQLTAQPAHYLAFTGDNPASADAIRSSETQLVKNVERIHIPFGGGWEDTQRNALRILTGKWDDRAKSLETIWRDPSTPTVAQQADATVKLVQAGIVPVEQAREDLGYGPNVRARMRDMDAEAQQDPIVSALAKNLAPAQPTAAIAPADGTA
jgi:hypothetical protein